MSVFCSNTLIFAPECWKCILRGSDFKIFPETGAFAASFFSCSIYSKLLLSIKNLIENPGFGERGLLIINVYMGRPRPEVWPLTAFCTIYDRKATCTYFAYLLLMKGTPFTYHTCSPKLCKCTVSKISIIYKTRTRLFYSHKMHLLALFCFL